MSIRNLFLSFTLLMLPAACTRYHAMPLDESAVRHGLTTPAPNALRVAAAQIKHPILRPVVIDDQQGITPDQAAVIAVVANPSLRAARDERGIAAAQLLSAGILPNPQLNFGESYPYGGNLFGATTASQIGLSWDVTQLLSRDAKVRAARAGQSSVDLDIAWQEWQIAQAARTAAYDLASAQDQLKLAQTIDAQLSQNLSIVRAAVDRHDKTLVDLAAAVAAGSDAHAAVLTQRREVAAASLALNKALGFSPDAQVILRAGISSSQLAALPSPDQILVGLENRRLDLMALRLGYQSQEQTLRAAVLEQFPKINIGFNRERDDTNVQLLGFAVTVDLPIFDRNQAQIAAETATRQKLYDEYIQRVFEARFDVVSAGDDLKHISAQIQDAQDSLPALQQQADAYRNALGAGNVDVLSYYTALNDLAQKQLDLLKLKQQFTDTMIALGLAAGEYLPV